MPNAASSDLVILGIDPGSQNTGVAILQGKQFLFSECWELPSDLSLACQALWNHIFDACEYYEVEVIAFEDFTWFGQKERTHIVVPLLHLLGVIRSFHASVYHLIPTRSGEWSRAIAGQEPPRRRDGAVSGEWKKIVKKALLLHCQADGIAGLDLGKDPGYHRQDAAGIALFAQSKLRLENGYASSQRAR